jgi:pimeloyl-ACP methyl ester carboxylesterase
VPILPKIAANRVSLQYEDAGPRDGPIVLLIAGLGQQLISWPAPFIQASLDAGCRLLWHDNRDVGLSTWLTSDSPINPSEWIRQRRAGTELPIAYTLAEMAGDAIGLLDALSIPAAHLVGASMGGMIAQHVAAAWPERVISLTSIMSSSGAPSLPGSSPEIQAALFSAAPVGATPEQLVTRTANFMRMISYPDPARSDSAFHAAAEAAFSRAYNPAGIHRQLLAVLADDQRFELLASIAAPTLVLHGAADKMVPPICGADTADRIPGAALEVIEHMAHDLPPSQVAAIAASITRHILASHESSARESAAHGRTPDLQLLERVSST